MRHCIADLDFVNSGDDRAHWAVAEIILPDKESVIELPEISAESRPAVSRDFEFGVAVDFDFPSKKFVQEAEIGLDED